MFITVNGLQLFYEQTGTGQLIGDRVGDNHQQEVDNRLDQTDSGSETEALTGCLSQLTVDVSTDNISL